MTEDEQQALLDTAVAAIEFGLQHGQEPPVPSSRFPALARPGACFVTLQRHGQLRGCIGSLEPRRALLEDVSSNAYAAAFRDPRFAPLSAAEWPDTRLSLSILGPQEALRPGSREQLLEQLTPGIHGLVIASREGHRATFLPSVWEQLPDPGVFIEQLLIKAGLPADMDTGNLQAWRYTCEAVHPRD